MQKLIAVILLFISYAASAQHRLVVKVEDKQTNEPLVSSTVSINKKNYVADSLGIVTISVAASKYNLAISHVGYNDTSLSVFIQNDTTINIYLTQKTEEGEEVIVSSSRTNSRIEDLPTKAEVLGAEELHEENGIKPGNIASLLGDIAGVQIQQTNAATGNADMRIQGLQGKYTQLLRDGMPLFGGYSGSFSILQIPPLDLQQIELVKGASSTLYGGGAIAGMVNLVSKKPKLHAPEKSFTVNRSTLQETNLNAFFSGRNNKTGYTLFAGGTAQNAIDVNKDGFSDVPSLRSTFIHPRLFLYQKHASLIIGYTFNYEDRTGGDMFAVHGEKNNEHQFFITNKSLRNTVDINYTYTLKNDASLSVKGSTSFFAREITTNVFGMKANQLSWYTEAAYTQKIKSHNFVAGINFNGEDFRKQHPDSSLLNNYTYNTVGLFAQDDWKLAPKLTLQAGFRIDVHNRFGAFALPRLSLMYKISAAVTTRIGGGLGYKTPTAFNAEVDERDYHYLLPITKNISAEKSSGINWDINYKTKINGWSLTANQTFFITTIHHAVLYDTGSSGVISYYNATKPLQTSGFETYVQLKKNALEIYLGYTYTNAQQKYNTVQPHLPLIALNKFASVLAYEFSKNFRAGIEAAHTGRQWLSNGATTSPYFFVAAMMRYNIGNAAIVLNCENLFDYRQNKKENIVFQPYTNPSFAEIWAPLDGRVVNLSVMIKF